MRKTISKIRFLPSRFRETSVLLALNATGAVPFGTFDPASNTLDLGDAVTFQTYRVSVESREAFRLEDFGYRADAAYVLKTELGWVRIAGECVSRVRDAGRT